MLSRYKSIFAYLALFGFSFIFFWPFVSGFLAMGNDFDQVYFAYKKYIFEFFQEGEIPFWSPSEGAGYSLIFNPFAQFFFPPSWILYYISSFFNYFSIKLYLIYTIFFVSLFSIFQFQWLKSFRIFSKKNCYVIAILSPCCLIISNFLRFPNAILTIAWLPLLLVGINYSCKDNKKIKSFFLIFISCLCIFTAGYPYIVIYFFIFCFFYSIFIYFFFPKRVNFFLYLCKIAFPIFIVLTLISPWLYGVLKTLSITQDRNVANYNFATEHIFTIKDYIGSLVYPIASNTEGRFFFGTIITFLFFYFIFSKQKKIFIKKSHFILFYFSLITSFFIIILGSANNVFFEFIWHKIPAIQTLRTWPRINILFLPIISIFLAFCLELISSNKFNFNEKIKAYFISLAIIVFQLFFYINNIKDKYWYDWHKKRFDFAKEYFNNFISNIFDFNQGLIHISVSLFLLLFLKLFFFNRNFKKSKKIFILYCFVFFFTIYEQFINSNIQWSLKNWNTKDTEINYLAKEEFKKNFLKPRGFQRVYGNHYFLDKQFSINMYWNWGNIYHNKIFWKYFTDFKGNFDKKKYGKEKKEIFLFFGLDNSAKKIFFNNSLDYNDLIDYVTDSISFEKSNNCKFKYKQILNNKLVIQFNCNSSGYLSYIDNTDFFWEAKLNGKNNEILTLFKTYKSIYFERGNNVLTFSYHPFKPFFKNIF